MARHTFVKEVEYSTGRLGWVTDVSVSEETVNIPTNSEIKRVVAESVEQIVHDISLRDRKLDKAAEQAAAAAKDAAEAKEEVKRLVETARETFREVIEEMLAPHYHLLALLAQHLGIELPAVAEKPKTIAEHPIGEEINEKPAVIKKKKTVVRRAKKKGGA